MNLETCLLTRRAWVRTMTGAAFVASRLSATDSASVVSLSETQRAALRRVIESAISRRAIPGGALVVLSRGQVVFREAFGRAEFDTERPFSIDAPCFIASLTKPISA